WLLAPPATTGTFRAAIVRSSKIAPSAFGLRTSSSSPEISSGATSFPPSATPSPSARVGELCGLGLIDVGNGQPRPFRAGMKGDSGRDRPGALHRDMKTVDAVLSESVLHRLLEPEE